MTNNKEKNQLVVTSSMRGLSRYSDKCPPNKMFLEKVNIAMYVAGVFFVVGGRPKMEDGP
jgi:hypothetical protein